VYFMGIFIKEMLDVGGGVGRSCPIVGIENII